jgi:predicted nucleotidyltransferase
MLGSPMQSPDPDPAELARRMRPILAAWEPLAAAWLFGSASRGALRQDSDVDVGLLLRDPCASAADHYLGLADLAARLESITAPRRVDLVLLEPQGPIFCHRALCEGRLICEPDRERRIAFEAQTVVRALDFLPTHELAVRGQAEGLLRRLRRGR